MKNKVVKTALKITAIVLIAFAIAAMVYNELRPKYIEECDGAIMECDYTILNVRSEPGEYNWKTWKENDIVTTIERGDFVELTGNYRTMSIGGHKSDDWAEVRIIKDGEGIVVTEEDLSDVQDGEEFTFFFGWVTTDGIREP